MFYENFIALCKARRIAPSRAALEAGLSRASASNWKNNPDTAPTAATLERLSNYFDVPVAAFLESKAVEVPPVMNFYERFAELCHQRGICPSRAAEEAGLSRSSVSKWKRDPGTVPSGMVLSKLSAYFGIPTSALLGEETPLTPMNESIKFALFGGRDDITPEMYEEVRTFAHFIMQREDQKKK